MRRHPTERHLALKRAAQRALLWVVVTSSFLLLPQQGFAFTTTTTHLSFVVKNAPHSSSKTRSRPCLYALPDIKDMKLRDMRAELESYGISTRTFLEKPEFVNALRKAREEGMTAVNGAAAGEQQQQQQQAKQQQPSSTSTGGDAYSNAYKYYNAQQQTNNNNSRSSTQQQQQQQQQTQQKANGQRQSTGKKKSPQSASSRAERIKVEMDKARSMRVSELKKKLNDMGMNTKAFFEKSEFVRAYAEAVVDGVKSGAASSVQEEEYDPEYRDVVMQKFDPNNAQQRYLLGGTIIDIEL